MTFDIDDTLVTSGGVDDACFIKAVSETLGKANFNPDWDSYAQVTEPGIAAEILEASFHRRPRADEQAAVQASFLRHLKDAAIRTPGCFRCIPGALELLEFLRRAPDFAVAFATAGWRSTASFKLTAAGMTIDDLPFASGEDGSSKTDIVVAATAKARLYWGVDAFDTHTHVGDRPSDHEAAIKIGCKFLGVATEESKATKLESRGVGHIRGDLTDVAMLAEFFRRA